jgi:hypothetical protein
VVARAKGLGEREYREGYLNKDLAPDHKSGAKRGYQVFEWLTISLNYVPSAKPSFLNWWAKRTNRTVAGTPEDWNRTCAHRTHVMDKKARYTFLVVTPFGFGSLVPTATLPIWADDKRTA